jgi:FkbM family methyltransferase
MKSLILDLGSNCGAALEYYMLKADLVVAVEANPILCGRMKESFSTSIQQGRLVIENCVVTAESGEGEVIFYIHKTHSPLSQFPKPDADKSNEFEEVRVKTKSIGQLISSYGMPVYIKIDLERYDQYILRSILANKILPQYISVEIHDFMVVDLLLGRDFYNAFKLVDGRSVHIQYRKCVIKPCNHLSIPTTVSFPRYSSGPFGDDVHGKWMDRNTIRKAISLEGPGWKDLHATIIPNKKANQYQNLFSYLLSRMIIDMRCAHSLLLDDIQDNLCRLLGVTLKRDSARR